MAYQLSVEFWCEDKGPLDTVLLDLQLVIDEWLGKDERWVPVEISYYLRELPDEEEA